MRVEVARVDHAAGVRLSNSTFLVRVTADGQPPVERCFIRHLATGREVFVQGGAGLGTFVRTCILDGPESALAAFDEIGG